jgi:hemerythrin
MMAKIVWKKDWVLDCSLIDEQHKQLITIVNRIIDKDILIQDLLEELIDYAARHFHDEEDLMIETKYPSKEFDLHKAEHRQFTNTLLNISFKLMDAKDDKDLNELVLILERFCVLWFQTHFLNTDKKFTEFLRKNNVYRRW